PVAVGRHVSFKVKKGSSKIYRSYTPVNFGSLPEDVDSDSANVSIAEPAKMLFAIKIYPQGICTPSLDQLQIGDTIEISEPVGTVDISLWTDPSTELFMLAAGTGLTPMINVLDYRLKKMSDQGLTLCSTTLLLFNKTEKDIIDDDWMPVKWSDSRIRIEHILSEPSDSWTGKIGRINADMLPLPNDNLRVLLCGPDGFVESAVKLLHAAGHKSENIHIFQG
ncbi:oxidoreductase NAD-binding domain protein, partial [Oesophagostomum dentatum]